MARKAARAPHRKAMRAKPARKAANKPAGKAKATKKGGFLLAKAGRRKNTVKGNARAGKSFVTRPSKRAGFVTHVYNINGRKVPIDVPKKGAKAATSKAARAAGRKRKPKGPGGGQFSK